MRKLLLVLLLVPAGAWAGPREDVYAASQRCAGLSDNRAWLDCYYGAAQPMRQQLQLPPAPPAQVALVPGFAPHSQIAAAPVSPPADHPQAGLFGSTLEANVPMSAYQFDRKGQFIITLANGETWQQSASDTSRASWTKPAAFYVVAIRQSSRGDVMEMSGDSTSYKVERVR